MRRVPSCLFFAALALSIALLFPQSADAGPGLRHAGGWGGHAGFRHGGYRHGIRGYARHGGFRHVGFGFRHGFGGYGRFGYPHYRYGYPGYGRRFFSVGYGPAYYPYGYGYRHGGYGRLGYGHHGYGRFGYGHHGHGRHFYGRSGYGSYGYGRYGYGFFPRSSWLWPSYGGVAPTVIVGEGDAPPAPAPAVPSLADLPASTGIRSAPAAAPAIYVVESGKPSARFGGAKIVSLDNADDDASGAGPHIIRLGPRGR